MALLFFRPFFVPSTRAPQQPFLACKFSLTDADVGQMKATKEIIAVGTANRLPEVSEEKKDTPKLLKVALPLLCYRLILVGQIIRVAPTWNFSNPQSSFAKRGFC